MNAYAKNVDIILAYHPSLCYPLSVGRERQQQLIRGGVMIYSRFGMPVTVNKINEEGIATIKFQDGCERKVHVSELKADGGMEEILKTIKRAN